MARTQNIKRFLWRKRYSAPLYTMEPACLVCLSSEYLTQGCGGLSLSLSLLVTDPAAPRPPAEREDVHRFSVRRRRGSTSRSAVQAVLSDQARRDRAYATCSLPQYGQIPPAAAHLVTSRRPPGIPSGLAPLPVFPRRCMWIFHSSLPKT